MDAAYVFVLSVHYSYFYFMAGPRMYSEWNTVEISGKVTFRSHCILSRCLYICILVYLLFTPYLETIQFPSCLSYIWISCLHFIWMEEEYAMLWCDEFYDLMMIIRNKDTLWKRFMRFIWIYELSLKLGFYMLLSHLL